jgi:ribonuclease-3
VALTHPSAVNLGEPHYERLEFLGDAVLDLAIADLLMRRFPTAKEGALSKERASIVNGQTLALKAIELGIERRLRLGKGEEKSGGRGKTSILAAAFEAIIGAIYSDGGLAAARNVIERLFTDEIGGPAAQRDYKTELQEIAYRRPRSRQTLYHATLDRWS